MTSDFAPSVDELKQLLQLHALSNYAPQVVIDGRDDDGRALTDQIFDVMREAGLRQENDREPDDPEYSIPLTPVPTSAVAGAAVKLLTVPLSMGGFQNGPTPDEVQAVVTKLIDALGKDAEWVTNASVVKEGDVTYQNGVEVTATTPFVDFSGWSALTNATCDGGLIGRGNGSVFCLVQADED